MKGTLKSKSSYRTELKENIHEINNDPYIYGSESDGDWYNKITEAMAEHTGHECDKAIRELIISDYEILLSEPKEPKEKKDIDYNDRNEREEVLLKQEANI